MKVRWSEDADHDRAEIAAYIWADSPAAAQRMDALFEAAAARLADFPRRGKESALPGMRELIPHPSYRVIYEVTDDEVVIHSIVHTSRLWPPVNDDSDA